LLWLFWRWGSCELFPCAGLNLTVLLISVSQIARITGVGHQCRHFSILLKNFLLFFQCSAIFSLPKIRIVCRKEFKDSTKYFTFNDSMSL
jgi:hypothetical protein